MRYTIESAIAQNGFDFGPLFRRAALQRVDHRHGNLTLAQIAGHRLTQNIFGRGQIEDIVDDLKSHAQVVPVLAQSLFLLGRGSSQNRSQSHANGKKAGGLAVNQIEMLIERDQLSELFHLQQFALDHLLRQFNQRVENAEVALLHRHLEGLHVEPVARQYTLRVAPLRVGRGTAAARLGLVNDVVMRQRGGVNDLDIGAQPHCSPSLVVKQFGRKEKKRRTNPLAAAVPQILPNLSDRLHARDGILPELSLQRRKIVVQQVEDFLRSEEHTSELQSPCNLVCRLL